MLQAKSIHLVVLPSCRLAVLLVQLPVLSCGQPGFPTPRLPVETAQLLVVIVTCLHVIARHDSGRVVGLWRRD